MVGEQRKESVSFRRFVLLGCPDPSVLVPLTCPSSSCACHLLMYGTIRLILFVPPDSLCTLFHFALCPRGLPACLPWFLTLGGGGGYRQEL